MIIGKSRAHLRVVGERYFEHQRIAFRYAGSCLQAGMMALVHGFIPGIFQTAASEKVRMLAEKKRPERTGRSDGCSSHPTGYKTGEPEEKHP